MIWVALGLSVSGAAQLFSGRRKNDVVEGQATPVSQPVQPVQDMANLSRVDALCDKLLEEIRKGPAVLREVVRMAGAQGFVGVNADCTVVCERPRIVGSREEMMTNLSARCSVGV